jgi:hypothetical protein
VTNGYRLTKWHNLALANQRLPAIGLSVTGHDMVVVALQGEEGAEIFHAGAATTPLFGFGDAPSVISVPDS